MDSSQELNTHQKALTINLDPTTYGSFAEIGAGQEVARWFLVVGGASGTVAKSISAYDKEVSDDLYGSAARYVSKDRLEAMLESEWTQLIAQLQQSRGSNTRFFSFVDTVSARNYAGSNEPHGWVGLRFQLQPRGQPSQIILHINMRDGSNLLEQEAIGMLGVHLIYAVFYQLRSSDLFLKDIAQNIEQRIEIDYVETRGDGFGGWNQREVLAQLVRAGLAQAVCFLRDRPPAPPGEVLHKMAVVLAPGSFEHSDPDHAKSHQQMLISGIEHLRIEGGDNSPTPMGLFCLSAMPLLDGDPVPEIRDLLERIDALQSQGGDVLLFRDRELYRMTDLVNRYTTDRVRFVVGLSLLIRVWDYHYGNLAGSFLEALSRLLAQNVRIYAYPMRTSDLLQSINQFLTVGWQWTNSNGMVSARQLRPPSPLNHLYEYVLSSGFLIPMEVLTTPSVADDPRR